MSHQQPESLAEHMRLRLNQAMTEDELLQAITDAASYLGWRWHHIRRSDQALQMGDGGFPDLVLARDGVVLFLELKTEAGRLSYDQERWVSAINGPIDPAIARVVRPHNLDLIIRELRGLGSGPPEAWAQLPGQTTLDEVALMRAHGMTPAEFDLLQRGVDSPTHETPPDEGDGPDS